VFDIKYVRRDWIWLGCLIRYLITLLLSYNSLWLDTGMASYSK
jgi:hypothetical protein